MNTKIQFAITTVVLLSGTGMGNAIEIGGFIGQVFHNPVKAVEKVVEKSPVVAAVTLVSPPVGIAIAVAADAIKQNQDEAVDKTRNEERQSAAAKASADDRAAKKILVQTERSGKQDRLADMQKTATKLQRNLTNWSGVAVGAERTVASLTALAKNQDASTVHLRELRAHLEARKVMVTNRVEWAREVAVWTHTELASEPRNDLGERLQRLGDLFLVEDQGAERAQATVAKAVSALDKDEFRRAMSDLAVVVTAVSRKQEEDRRDLQIVEEAMVGLRSEIAELEKRFATL